MNAKPGNRLWELRSKHGRDALFKDAQKLWEAAEEYFVWCQDQTTFIKGVNVPRPFTIQGLCLYLDCSCSWFYEAEKRYKAKDQGEFLKVVQRIRTTIYEQKFTGASIGIYNPIMISRDLGLKEATTNEHTGPDGAPIQTDNTIKVEFIKPKKDQ